MKQTLVATLALAVAGTHGEKLVFSDDFDELDINIWQPEITLGGGGNWESEAYFNNRSTSYAENSTLFLKPVLMSDFIGEENVQAGYTMDIWGSSPSDMCTGNAFYGCSRASGTPNILNPIHSARLRTVNTFTFKYGRVEVRAQLPKGDWLWPAIWLLPASAQYGNWPASGEIDLMESRGNDKSYPAGGCDTFGSTLHWGPYWPEDPYELTHAEYTLDDGDLTEDFHTYGLLWNSTHIITYIDSEDNQVLNVDMSKQSFFERGGWDQVEGTDNPWRGRGNNAPFDREFYLIMNVAVAGTAGYFPDGVGGKPWSDTSPTAMNEFYAAKDQWYPTWDGENAALRIDSVKVWQ